VLWLLLVYLFGVEREHLFVEDFEHGLGKFLELRFDDRVLLILKVFWEMYIL
jgi:hypothetical protein